MGPVERVSCFVVLVFPVLRGLSGLREKTFDFGRLHWPETPRRLQRLVEYPHRVTAGDHDAGLKVHRVVQALDGSRRFAFENDVIAHRFHSQHADIVPHEYRQDLHFKTVVVCIHHVQRYLHRIESEVMRRGGLEHLQMDIRTFVACETDIADSSRFLGLERSFHRPAGGEDAVRIGHADDFVKL